TTQIQLNKTYDRDSIEQTLTPAGDLENIRFVTAVIRIKIFINWVAQEIQQWLHPGELVLVLHVNIITHYTSESFCVLQLIKEHPPTGPNNHRVPEHIGSVTAVIRVNCFINWVAQEIQQWLHSGELVVVLHVQVIFHDTSESCCVLHLIEEHPPTGPNDHRVPGLLDMWKNKDIFSMQNGMLSVRVGHGDETVTLRIGKRDQLLKGYAARQGLPVVPIPPGISTHQVSTSQTPARPSASSTGSTSVMQNQASKPLTSSQMKSTGSSSKPSSVPLLQTPGERSGSLPPNLAETTSSIFTVTTEAESILDPGITDAYIRIGKGRDTFVSHIDPNRISQKPVFDFSHMTSDLPFEVFQYSVSGISFAHRTSYTPAEWKKKVYEDLHLSEDFEFAQVYVQMGTNDFKNLATRTWDLQDTTFDKLMEEFNTFMSNVALEFGVTAFALGASPPPICQYSSFVHSGLVKDYQGLPIFPLRFSDGSRQIADSIRTNAAHALQDAVHNYLVSIVGIRQGNLKIEGPAWIPLPTPILHLFPFAKTCDIRGAFGHLFMRAYLVLTRDHVLAIQFGLAIEFGVQKWKDISSCYGTPPAWLPDGTATCGKSPRRVHNHCGANGEAYCFGKPHGTLKRIGEQLIPPNPFDVFPKVFCQGIIDECFSLEFIHGSYEIDLTGENSADFKLRDRHIGKIVVGSL
ncbi:unnamed protein product, partial [Notodromas monacha]